MPVPAKRRSRSRKRRNYSHAALKTPTLIVCIACGKKTRPHEACGFCGVYKSKTIVTR